MKYEVWRVVTECRRELVYQIEVKDVRPGTSGTTVVVEYLKKQLSPRDVFNGIAPQVKPSGIYILNWLVLNDVDVYWIIPCDIFSRSITPVIL